MPTEVLLSAAIAFLALMMLMRTWPRVVLAAVPKNSCGFVPNV